MDTNPHTPQMRLVRNEHTAHPDSVFLSTDVADRPALRHTYQVGGPTVALVVCTASDGARRWAVAQVDAADVTIHDTDDPRTAHRFYEHAARAATAYYSEASAENGEVFAWDWSDVYGARAAQWCRRVGAPVVERRGREYYLAGAGPFDQRDAREKLVGDYRMDSADAHHALATAPPVA